MTNHLKEFGKDVCPSKGKWPVKMAKNAQIEIVPWGLVPRYPYVVLNTTSIQWVHIDVDLAPEWQDLLFHPAFDTAIFDNYCLQYPNFSVHSGDSFHLAWLLKRSLPLVGSPASMSFLYDVRRKLNQALEGDASCPLRNVAFKNPAYRGNRCRCWGSKSCYLDKLNIDVDISKNRTIWEKADYGEGQRNESTFRSALNWWKEGGQKATFEELIDYIATYQESFQDARPLSRSENASIANSIIRNGERYKTRANRNYGAMQLPDAQWREMSPEERRAEIQRHQQLGAHYTNQQQKQSTNKRIEASIDHLISAGKKITARGIAGQSGLSYRTVCSRVALSPEIRTTG